MTFEMEHDQIPFFKQYVSVLIILLNSFLFIVQLLDPDGNMLIEAGFTPLEFIKGIKIWTIFSSMFMHANFLHLFLNMWFFYVVADNSEFAMGHFIFLATYLVSGISAALFHTAFAIYFESLPANIPLIGASGAISGIIAVYGILFPNNKLAVFLGFTLIPVKARYFIFLYLTLQIISGLFLWGATSTAFFAHIGGFLAGVILGAIFKYTKCRDLLVC